MPLPAWTTFAQRSCPSGERTTLTDPPRPFSVPVFRHLWFASLAANFGVIVQNLAAAWAMAERTGRADMVALVQTAATLPIMLCALPAGALADIVDRRRQMLAAQLFMFVATAAIAAASFGGSPSPLLLLASCCAIGLGTAAFGPAVQVFVTESVPSRLVPAAVAINGISYNLARSLGPTLGGLLIAASGIFGAFAAAAACYLFMIVLLLRLRSSSPDAIRPSTERLAPAMLGGLRFAMHAVPVRTILVRTLLFSFAASPVWALMPMVARDMPGGGPELYGVMLGALGAGAIAGGLLAGHARRRANEHIARATALGLAISLALIAPGPRLAIALPALVLAGGSWTMAMVNFNVAVQLSSPRWVASRALALYQTCAFGGLALGSWGWGTLAETWGIALGLGGGAAVLAISALAGRFLAMPDPRFEDVHASAPLSAIDEDVAIGRREGPVVVQVCYLVAAENCPLFHERMTRLAGCRARNGARSWWLARDIGREGCWIEQFQLVDWSDYLRFRERSTVADRAAFRDAAALHEGAQAPTVRRLIRDDRNFGRPPFVLDGNPRDGDQP